MGLMLRLGALNTLKRKKKLVLIVLCMSIGISFISATAIFGIHTLGVLNSYTEVHFFSNYISVLNRNGQNLTESDRDILRNIDGVRMVCKDAGITYSIGGDKGEGEFIMSGMVYEADLNDFPYADLTDTEGIVIPDQYYPIFSEDIKILETSNLIDDPENVNLNDAITGKIVGQYHYEYYILCDSRCSTVFVSEGLFEQAETYMKEQYGTDSIYCNYILYIDPSYDIYKICNQIIQMGYDAGCYDGSTRDFAAFFYKLCEFMAVIGGVILVLSAWMAIRELTFNLDRRKKNIGIMKAFGYRNSKIMGMIIAETAIYCLGASAVAVPVSVALVGRLSLLSSVLKVPVNFGYIMATIGMCLLISAVIGGIAVLKTYLYSRKMEALDILKGE